MSSYLSDKKYLSSQFSKVTCILDKLQGRLLLSEAVKTVDLFEDCLEEEYKDKFTRVLERNPDWETVRKIGKILSGEANVAINIRPDVICNFKFAPIVSVDVERCFSQLTRILSPQRQRLLINNLRHLMIIMWKDAE